MDFKRFSVLISIRIAFLMISLLILVWLIITPGYQAATLLTMLATLLLGHDIVRFVSKTNTELVRFLDAARYADFSQRFDMKSDGTGFGELGQTFNDILERFRLSRSEKEAELRQLRALSEHVPVPLLSLFPNGEIVQHNNAARRLFGVHRVTKLEDLQAFGGDFAHNVFAIEPGERRLVTFSVDDMEQQLTIAATRVTVAGQSEKLMSLQDIQSELDVAQLQAWQDLVRVLTHEIMNSITPVASLAKTAADLVEDAAKKLEGSPDVVEELQDVRSAVETVARRSDSLMHFVGGYRRLTRLPAPKKTIASVKDIFSDIEQLTAAEMKERAVKLTGIIEPSGLEINCDADMIQQVLINLLQNAAHALEGKDTKEIRMIARMSRRGQTVLEIQDSGDGIAEDIISKVFVPFFTTKRDGSGVGLALSRQIMLAHGGSLKVQNHEDGGAHFTLTF